MISLVLCLLCTTIDVDAIEAVSHLSMTLSTVGDAHTQYTESRSKVYNDAEIAIGIIEEMTDPIMKQSFQDQYDDLSYQYGLVQILLGEHSGSNSDAEYNENQANSKNLNAVSLLTNGDFQGCLNKCAEAESCANIAINEYTAAYYAMHSLESVAANLRESAENTLGG